MVEAVRAVLPDAMHVEAWRGPRRSVAWSALLGVLVVVTAGVTEQIRSSGLRWVPRLSGGQQPKAPPHSGPIVIIKGRHLPKLGGGGSLPLWVIIVIAVVGAIVVLCLIVVAGRYLAGLGWSLRLPGRRGPAQTLVAPVAAQIEPEPEPDAPVLRSGIEYALQLLDEGEREPADAIVRAWLGLEQTAEESGVVRGPAETPSEFTARILKGAFADDHATRTLLRLYLRTRFGDHPPTAQDVATVRAALRDLVATWSTPSSPTR